MNWDGLCNDVNYLKLRTSEHADSELGCSLGFLSQGFFFSDHCRPLLLWRTIQFVLFVLNAYAKYRKTKYSVLQSILKKICDPRSMQQEFRKHLGLGWRTPSSYHLWFGIATVQPREACRIVPAGEGGVQDKFRVVTRSELKLRLILRWCFVH